mmetsp:Transcript_60722/g.123936  ORF Transcript_60722/g.123936 Transcript_60722/m.123936 type:complete len:84 (+) Transcript_60722:778-1029(+)
MPRMGSHSIKVMKMKKLLSASSPNAANPMERPKTAPDHRVIVQDARTPWRQCRCGSRMKPTAVEGTDISDLHRNRMELVWEPA